MATKNGCSSTTPDVFVPSCIDATERHRALPPVRAFDAGFNRTVGCTRLATLTF